MSQTTAKVAFITNLGLGKAWGGSEELWSQTAIRLAQQGIRVEASVHSCWFDPGRLQALEQAGCRLVPRWDPQNLRQKLAYRLYGPRRVGRWLQRFNPDLVVISQGANLDGVIWMQQCCDRQIPYVTISQAATEGLWPADGAAELAAQVYQAAERNFFVSQANLELTCKQLAVELKNGVVIRNPFNIPYQIAVPWPTPREVWKLACVGRLEPASKGQDILLEVLRAQKWRDRPLEVTLFGSGDSQQSLQRLSQLWQLSQVKFGGFVTDVAEIWATHQALVLPSRYEGLPLVVVEAMLCGRPCIVTDVAGNAELVEDNVTGFVAAAPQVAALDEALERAWRGRDTWAAMGQVAAQRVRQLIPSDPVGVFVAELEQLLPG